MNDVKMIEVKENILADNEQVAKNLRSRLAKSGTLLVNLMGSPGAGKTSFILKTIEKLHKKIKIGVIEADIDSMVDAELVAGSGVRAVQLRTGGFCHVDASMVSAGLDVISCGDLDLVLLENVGNLVCPAEFDTGAHVKVGILSVPEGDDKPLKYPLIFSTIDVLIVSKIDFLGMTNFKMEALKQRALNLNPTMKIFEVSVVTGEGVEKWVDWLQTVLSPKVT